VFKGNSNAPCKGKSIATMSQSLSKVYVHITFSTKNHQPYIDNTIEISLFEYIAPAFAPSGLLVINDNPNRALPYSFAFALSGLKEI
jgi:hypothetical protein